MLDIRLLNAEECTVSENWNYPDIISPYYRIYFVTKGKAAIFNNSAWHELEPGFIYFIPAFTRNSYFCKSYFEHVYIHFTIEHENDFTIFSNDSQIKSVKYSKPDLWLVRRFLELNPNKALKNYEPRTYNNIQETIINPFENTAIHLETKGILLQILSRFISKGFYKKANTLPMKLELILRYIQQNIDKKITVEMLAKQICLSKDYFSKFFLRYVKTGPIEYINKKRIEKAQLLLITTSHSIKQIGYTCGYENMANFHRQFKMECKLTPKQFREIHRRIKL